MVYMPRNHFEIISWIISMERNKFLFRSGLGDLADGSGSGRDFIITGPEV